MCFDVPKVVQSPGYDHGHDEESRNGRDIKIDILDDYVWTPERFREVSDIYRSTGGYRNPPGKLLGLMGLSGKERGRPGGGARPPLPQSELGKGRGRRPPFSFLLSTSSFPLLLLGIGKGGQTYLE